MPLPKKSPDTLKRVVIWQPNTGATWDGAGGDVLKDWAISPSSNYFNGGDGSQHEISRQFQASFGIVPENLAEGIKIIRRQKCPIRAVFFGFLKHTLWLEKTRMNTLPQRGGTGLLATERVHLQRRAAYPHIYDYQNIIGGFPWHCAQVQPLYEDDENPETVTGYLLHSGNPSTLLGWVITGTPFTPSVGYDGVLDAVGGTATLEFEFPVPNAVLRYEGFGSLSVLGHPDSTVGTIATVLNGGTITLPPHTWALRVTVFSGSDLPTVTVEDVGQPIGYRFGVCSVCDINVVPPWAEPTATCYTENLKPQEITAECYTENLKFDQGSIAAECRTENLKLNPDSDSGGTGEAFTQNLKRKLRFHAE